jgi:outer membrane protein assembly factor BamB
MAKRLLAFVLIGVAGTVAVGADWPQFRGPNSAGVAGETLPAPLGLDGKAAWRADLPGRGVSSPVVIGGRVFVTASSGPRQDRLHVLAFDAREGRRLWQRTFWATGPTASHPKTCMAAPTPAGDGRHVVALFATNDLACLDQDGNLLWLRSLYGENPGATDGRGLASSPVIVNGRVVVQVEDQNTSFAAAIDLETGADCWRVDRPRGLCWSSPVPLPGRAPAEALVLLQGAARLSALDPATGREVWGLDHRSGGIASAATDGRVLVVPGDRALTAYALQPGGAAPKQLWEQPRLDPETASPVVAGDRVYVLRGNFLAVGDLKTGKVLAQLRLPGPFWASPVWAGGHLYCLGENGEVRAVKADAGDPRVAEEGDLHEALLATPAPADGALYLRSDHHLWRFGRPG